MNVSRGSMALGTVLLGAAAITAVTGMSTASAAGGEDYQVAVRAPQANGSLQSDVRTEAMLRHIPGTVHVTAETLVTGDVAASGRPGAVAAVSAMGPILADFLRGDIGSLGYKTVAGRMFTAVGEVVASTHFLHERGLAVGDRMTLDLGATPGGASALPAHVTIVGETSSSDAAVVGGWDTLAAVAPERWADRYRVQLIPDANVVAYEAAVKTADPELEAQAEGDSSTAGFFMILAGAGFVLLAGIGLAVWGSRSGIND